MATGGILVIPVIITDITIVMTTLVIDTVLNTVLMILVTIEITTEFTIVRYTHSAIQKYVMDSMVVLAFGSCTT